jgi:hypothetical protein
VIATRVHHRAHLPIVANVALRVDLQIDAMLVHQLGVRMNAGPSVHAILVHLPIVRPVHTVIATLVQVQIAQQVVHTVTEIPARHHVQAPIVPVEITHSVAIVHAQAMIAMPVHLAMIVAVRVTANAADVQIVPEVVSPMIAKNVHAVELAKSA